MKVSVVIPTYYRPSDLSELFNSLLKQTLKPLEVIVVDDTPIILIKAVCQEYEAKFKEVGINLIYVKNPKERSAAVARNVGAERAGGDIVMFLDSDVILHPTYIENILRVFKEHSNAVGVQGWIVFPKKHKVYYIARIIRKMFLLPHHSKNSCKFLEYPIILTKTINCEALSGANMAFKRSILNEFKFDENLKKYSFMEDLLLSHSVYKKYPNDLYITPHAKCLHKTAKEGKMEGNEWRNHLRQCRKYVLTKLFGLKGSLIYYWQNVGILIIGSLRKIWSFVEKKDKS